MGCCVLPLARKPSRPRIPVWRTLKRLCGSPARRRPFPSLPPTPHPRSIDLYLLGDHRKPAALPPSGSPGPPLAQEREIRAGAAAPRRKYRNVPEQASSALVLSGADHDRARGAAGQLAPHPPAKEANDRSFRRSADVGSGPSRFVKGGVPSGSLRIVYEKNPYYIRAQREAERLRRRKLAKVLIASSSSSSPTPRLRSCALRMARSICPTPPARRRADRRDDRQPRRRRRWWPIETYVRLRPNSIRRPSTT